MLGCFGSMWFLFGSKSRTKFIKCEIDDFINIGYGNTLSFKKFAFIVNKIIEKFEQKSMTSFVAHYLYLGTWHIKHFPIVFMSCIC